MPGLAFTLARTVSVSPFVADAAPNVAPPDPQQVFNLPPRIPGAAGDKDVRGHSLYIRVSDDADAEVPSATVDFTTWVRDVGDTPGPPSSVQRWVSIQPEAGAPSGAQFSGLFVGDLFVQITAVANVGAGTKAEVWIAPRGLV